MNRLRRFSAISIALLGILFAAGWYVHCVVDRAFKEAIGNRLTTIRDANVMLASLWFDTQTSRCSGIAEQVRDETIEFVERSDRQAISPRLLRDDQDYQRLIAELKARTRDPDCVGWTLQSATGDVLAAWDDALVGRSGFPLPPEAMNRAVGGTATVSTAFRSPIAIAGRPPGMPVIASLAPINDDHGHSVAVLAILVSPADAFSSILKTTWGGASSDTYAFDREGRLVSRCRFEDQLRQFGLLTQDASVDSVLNIRLADPKMDLRDLNSAVIPSDDQPLTRMAYDATRGGTGIDLEGYNDYRGVPVIGAWAWLSDYSMGIATEIDVEEAYRPSRILRFGLIGLSILIALATAFGIFVFERGLPAAATQSNKQPSSRKFGQYKLDELLATGGAGSVYKAQHALLKRPVAIKVLDNYGSDGHGLHRFGREVELTSQLTSPHTVTIYDYGQTQHGDFYYVMEYLDGVDLGFLVREYGAQSSERVVAILLQICESLIEAHAQGLIHRDVKPGNVMLTQKPDYRDHATLLDFGLVKESTAETASVTREGKLTGTPMYMSPEAIRNPTAVDARSDIYSIGALGYFLLTGEPVFDAAGTIDALIQQINEEPVPPSQRCDQPMDSELEDIMMRCLAKEPRDRPETVRELKRLLNECQCADGWNSDRAREWWQDDYRQQKRESTVLSGSDTIDPTEWEG